MSNIERNGPDMNPPSLPTGTLIEDLGCPHCGKVCDVCVTLDEIAADDRQLLRGAVEALREVARRAPDGAMLAADWVSLPAKDWLKAHDAPAGGQ